MKINKINKKAGSISIALLVLMTLCLIGASLFTFYKHSEKVGTQIKDSRFLDEIYVKENKMNFYINELMDRSVINLNSNSEVKTSFINNFKKQLESYDNTFEFSTEDSNDIKSQLIPENIEIKDNIISLKLKIKINRDFDNFQVSYLNEKIYSRVF